MEGGGLGGGVFGGALGCCIGDMRIMLLISKRILIECDNYFNTIKTKVNWGLRKLTGRIISKILKS